MNLFFEGKPFIARYDILEHPIFDKLTEKQMAFFWRPQEVHLDLDKIQYEGLRPIEQHVFISNLQYQILLDTIQSRNPSMLLLPHVSNAELESFIETWSFFESIHNRSYTHIIRGIMNDPSVVFDAIPENDAIIARANEINKYYDALAADPNEDTMYLAVHAINILEGIRFYASLACSFAFGERALMEGNAKIIKLIARDEQLHYVATQNIIRIMNEENPTLFKKHEEEIYAMFQAAAEQESQWSGYLFQDSAMIGLNGDSLNKYVEYITNKRMKALGLNYIYPEISNPLPWMVSWLQSGNVQVAPQETEITSYMVGAINKKYKKEEFKGFKL